MLLLYNKISSQNRNKHLKMTKNQNTVLLCLCFFSFSLSAQRPIYILSYDKHKIYAIEESDKREVQNYSKEKLKNPFDLIFVVEREELYWTDLQEKGINKDKEGTTSKYSQELSTPVDAEINQAKGDIYWIDHDKKSIYHGKITGTAKSELLLDSLSNPSCLTVSDAQNLLFWGDLDKQAIFVAPLNNVKKKQILVDSIGYPVRLAVDDVNGYLYWTNDVDHKVERIDFRGREQQTLYVGSDGFHPYGLYIDATQNKLYWTDYGADRVFRANLDGTRQEDFLGYSIPDPISISIGVYPKAKELQGSAETALAPTTDTFLNAEHRVFPNPGSGALNFEFSNLKAETMDLMIMDVQGRLIRKLKVEGNPFRLDVSNLLPGTYFYQFKSPIQSFQGNFILIQK